MANVTLIKLRKYNDGKRAAPSYRPPYFLKTLESMLSETQIKCQLIDLGFDKTNLQSISSSFIVIDFTHFDFSILEELLKNNQFNRSHVILTGQAASSIFNKCLTLEKYVRKLSIIAGEPEELVLKSILNDKVILEPKKQNFSSFSNRAPLVFTNKELQNYQHFFPMKGSKDIFWGHIMISRGCPHSCTFCTSLIRDSYGKKMRYRSNEILRKELDSLKSLGVNSLAFGDDDITADPLELTRVCNFLIKQNFNFKWTAQVRFDECDESLLRLMKESGCSYLRFGIESASEKMLKYYNKTDNAKEWVLNLRRTIKMCMKNDIQTCGLFILGGPGETFKDLARTSLLIQTSLFNLIQLHIFTAYPDTIEGKNRKLKDSGKNHYDGVYENHSNVSNFTLKLFYIFNYIFFYYNPIRVIVNFWHYTGFIIKNFCIFKKQLHFLFSALFSMANSRGENESLS